jgi:hypothetical protein
MSNLCAIITAILAGVVADGWWVDPVGAIAISLYIVVRWLAIAKQQVRLIYVLVTFERAMLCLGLCCVLLGCYRCQVAQGGTGQHCQLCMVISHSI